MKSSRSEPPGWDVEATINSGQVFLWERHGDSWFGVDGCNIIRVPDDPRHSESLAGGEGEFLRLDDDVGAILSEISADGMVASAVRRYPGLRLLRQDPFQCCISFITSSNSAIPRIKRTLYRLCVRYGEQAEFCGRQFRLFPTPERLSQATVRGLLGCGLGYRARFVRDASRAISSGAVDLSGLRGTAYGEARQILTELPGVGGKVADCVMLFSLDILDAFPLDRWMIRVLCRHYPGMFLTEGTLTPKRYDELHHKIVDHFGPYAGYAQQFLFKMERDFYGGRWIHDAGPLNP